MSTIGSDAVAAVCWAMAVVARVERVLPRKARREVRLGMRGERGMTEAVCGGWQLFAMVCPNRLHGNNRRHGATGARPTHRLNHGTRRTHMTMMEAPR